MDSTHSNTEVFVSTSIDDNLENALESCWPTKKYALIVHGWRESCETPWAKVLRDSKKKIPFIFSQEFCS